MKTISPEEFRKSFAKRDGNRPVAAKKANNIRATKTRGKDGRIYDSKLETKQANELYEERELGLILDYLCQVPVVFACGIRWRVDFMVLNHFVQPRFIEVKGRAAIDRDWIKVKKLLKHEKPWIYERLEVRAK